MYRKKNQSRVICTFLLCFFFLFYIYESKACSCLELNISSDAGKNYNSQEGIAYSKTNKFKKEFAQAISNAKKALSKHVGQQRIALVSDIDETLLDNRPYFEQEKKFVKDKFNSWVEESRAPLLTKTASLINWAKKNGYAVFLITGRAENQRGATIANLVRYAVPYDGLYMRAIGDSSKAVDFKSKIREQIEKMGFKIIVNIGDQYSDLLGGYAEDCEKLPNAMYYIP